MRKINGILFIIFILLFAEVAAQSVTSPYSFYGLGEINDKSLVHNDAMGGVGIGLPSDYNINLKNPAWLTYNLFTSFNVGLKADIRNFKTAETTGSDATGSARYMVLAIPVIPGKWGSSLSLLPYSTVNYKLNTTSKVVNGSDDLIVTNKHEGSGGLTQFSWSNGFKLINNINVGIRTSYIFGSVNRITQNYFENDTSIIASYVADFEKNETYNDFIFAISFAHKYKIADEKFINYGIVYDLAKKLNGKRNETLSRLDGIGKIAISSVDITKGKDIIYKLPTNIGFGVSYEKLNKLKVGLDLKYATWKDNLEFDLKNTLNIAIGGVFTPDHRDINSYFNRINYRAGINYGQIPYITNETEISEFGINFGASFPVGGISSIDTAFKFGWRGTTENDLIRETFFQVVFGLTINDRWFIQRRYD